MSNPHWTLPIRHEDTPKSTAPIKRPDPHQDTFSKNVLGFWLYLMTDCLVFTTLFATYAILHNSTFGGPTTRDVYSLTTAFGETMVLLFSSVCCGFAILTSIKGKPKQVVRWLLICFGLGITFIAMEVHEFSTLIVEGHDWKVSAFLSSYFALVGTHGLHVTIGLVWMAVIIAQINYQGINLDTFRRLIIFSLFWHFLDVVWIFIFTFVYLMGVI